MGLCACTATILSRIMGVRAFCRLGQRKGSGTGTPAFGCELGRLGTGKERGARREALWDDDTMRPGMAGMARVSQAVFAAFLMPWP